MFEFLPNPLMQKFFSNIESIDQFTFALDYHQHTLTCDSCLSHGQFVSHGFVYKQRSQMLCEPVGKRILCSNRYGRTGCGRTMQLYLASELPSCHYGTAQLIAFIDALFANVSIATAYANAIGKHASRHAWRWFKKLTQQLMTYRSHLQRDAQTHSPLFTTQSRFRKILLPTLHALFFCQQDNVNNRKNSCAAFQQIYQVPFM
jgi:hypothetical protein